MAAAGARRRWVAPLLALALSAAVVLESLDSAIAEMHLPRSVPGGFGAVASPTSVRDPAHAVAITQGWVDWDEATRTLSAADVINLYAGVDAVFALVLAALLLSALAVVSPPGPVDPGTRRSAVRAVRVGAVPVVGIYLIADWAETQLVARLWDRPAESPAGAEALLRAVGASSLIKWIALALVVVALLIALVERVQVRRQDVGLTPLVTKRGSPLVALRGQLAVVGVLVVLLTGLSGSIGRQVDDVVIRTFHDPLLAIGACAAALGFAAVLLLGCRVTIRAYADAPPNGSLSRRAQWSIAVVGVVTLAGGLVLLGPVNAAVGAPLATIGGLLVVLSLLNLPAMVRDYAAGPESPSGPEAAAAARAQQSLSWALVPYIVAAALFALYLAVLRAAVRLWVNGNDVGVFAWWVWGLGVATAFVVWLTARLSPTATTHENSGTWGPAFAWNGAALSLILLGAWWGLDLAPRAGSVTVLLLGFAVLTVAVTGLVLVGDAWAARGALSLLGLRRVPVLALVVVLATVASVIDTRAAYYDARVLDVSRVQRVGLTNVVPTPRSPMDDAFDQWVGAQEPGRDVVPLVLISASGGGIRAAYWTSLAWQCLYGAGVTTPELEGHCQGDLDPASVFMASAVSGSSAGFAMVRARELDLATREAESGTAVVDDGAAWLESTFEPDYLASVLAATAFRDIPNSLVRAPVTGLDRASSLEIAWERENPGMASGFAAAAYTGADDAPQLRFPTLFFNGTSVTDGCRLAVTVIEPAEASKAAGIDCRTPSQFTREGIDGTPPRPANGVLAATKDAFQWTCPIGAKGRGTPADLRLSTAAMLSARFPYISPAGGLGACHDGSSTHVLDGGLVDNSGADALVEVWQELAPQVRAHNAHDDVCIVPRLVMLDSGFASLGVQESASRPLQLIAPAGGLGSVFESRSAAAQQEAMIAMTRSMEDAAGSCASRTTPTTGPAVAHLFPQAGPGSQALLGWTLTSRSQEVMREELAHDDNLAHLEAIRAWYPDVAGPSGLE